MTRIRLLDGVDRERTDRIDRELIEFYAGQTFQLCLLHRRFAPLSAGAFRGRLLDMAAELVTHGREQFVGEVRFAARTETLVERRGQHVHRYAFIDAGLDRP